MALSRLTAQRANRNRMSEIATKDFEAGGKSFNNNEDNRFWKLTRDKTGTGSAVIRFLPATGNDELPWVKLYSYAFQGPTGKWFINDSPSSIGEKDPVMEANAELWATGFEADKELARKRKRKTSYIYNILVLKDPANPENDGKVFLFKAGKSIHDMIGAKAKPQFEDDEPVFVYDLWEGANFKLRIYNKDKYPTYENSVFDSPSALFGGDEEKLEEVLGKCHSLSEFLEPSRFKSYDQLKKELDRCLSTDGVKRASESIDEEDDTDVEYTPRQALEKAVKVEREVKAAAPVEKVEKVEKLKKVEVFEDDSDTTSDLDYFAKLLADT